MSPVQRFPEFDFKTWTETPFRQPATKHMGSFLTHCLVMEVSLWFEMVEVQTQVPVGWFRSWLPAYGKMHPLHAERFGLIRTSYCSPLGLTVVCPLTLGLFSRRAFCLHVGKQPNSLSPLEQLFWQLDRMITLLSSSLGGRKHFLPLWLAKYYIWPWAGMILPPNLQVFVVVCLLFCLFVFICFNRKLLKHCLGWCKLTVVLISFLSSHVLFSHKVQTWQQSWVGRITQCSDRLAVN